MACAIGLASGPALVRLTVLCGLGSLPFLASAVMAIQVHRSALLAARAGLFVPAVTLAALAYEERKTRHESSSAG